MAIDFTQDPLASMVENLIRLFDAIIPPASGRRNLILLSWKEAAQARGGFPDPAAILDPAAGREGYARMVVP